MAYVLGITRVDPIRHNLLFERFINEGRTTYPDVDIDFSSERREEVIQYVYGKYGPEHTGMVCNLVTYRARSAVREVGYALGFPRPLVDRVAKALETYDSVMVRRDLEADGGFGQFFARPGSGSGGGGSAAGARRGKWLRRGWLGGGRSAARSWIQPGRADSPIGWGSSTTLAGPVGRIPPVRARSPGDGKRLGPDSGYPQDRPRWGASRRSAGGAGDVRTFEMASGSKPSIRGGYDRAKRVAWLRRGGAEAPSRRRSGTAGGDRSGPPGRSMGADRPGVGRARAAGPADGPARAAESLGSAGATRAVDGPWRRGRGPGVARLGTAGVSRRVGPANHHAGRVAAGTAAA